MYKIQFINLCITEFSRRFRLTPRVAFNYMRDHEAIEFLERNYDAQHQLPLSQTIKDIADYCRRRGGTL